VLAQAALGDGRAASAAHPDRRPPTRRSSYAERLRQVADAMAAEMRMGLTFDDPEGGHRGVVLNMLVTYV